MRNNMGGNGDGFPRVPRRPGEAGLFTVPRWEELVADPSRAGVLDARTARIVAAKALGVFAASLYRLFEAADDDDSASAPRGAPAWRDGPASGSRTLPGLDDVATVEEVAGIIDKPRRWIIRNAANLPFVTRVSRKHYVCSRIALRRWLATRPRTLKGQ
ncbi:MAG: hypothetical protein ACREQT_00750 [Candidatus Binataceae bacterium]